MFDVTNRISFESVSKWVKKIEESINNEYKVILIGNKIDLKKERNVSKLEATELAKKKGFLYCLLYTSPSPRDLSTSRMPSSA